MAPVEQDQPTFLPPALGDLIPENDRCRVVNAFGNCLPRAVHFMWLAGGNHSSFNTVNRFRGDSNNAFRNYRRRFWRRPTRPGKSAIGIHMAGA